MAGFQMALHRSDSVSHLAEGHIFIGRALVFQKQMDVPVIARGGLHAPENIAGVLPSC